jgi:hypothetical protein
MQKICLFGYIRLEGFCAGPVLLLKGERRRAKTKSPKGIMEVFHMEDFAWKQEGLSMSTFVLFELL